MGRWPRKPPRGHTCDAHVGGGFDQTGAPVAYRCRNEAAETMVDTLGHEVWVCKECAPRLAAKGQARRNPRVPRARGRWFDPDALPELGSRVPMWICNCGNAPLADDEPWCRECDEEEKRR